MGQAHAATVMRTISAVAIQEIKRPDSYYLVPCKAPDESASDNLADILALITKTLEDGADCHNRHNPLVDQLMK